MPVYKLQIFEQQGWNSWRSSSCISKEQFLFVTIKHLWNCWSIYKKQCNFKHLIIFVPLEVSLGSMQCMQEQKLIKMRTLLANIGQTNWTLIRKQVVWAIITELASSSQQKYFLSFLNEIWRRNCTNGTDSNCSLFLFLLNVNVWSCKNKNNT